MEEKKAMRSSNETEDRLRFKNYLVAFMEHHVEAKRLRSKHEVHQVMRDHILPVLGERMITEITKKEVVDLLDDASRRSGSVANKIFDWLRTMMNFARRRSDLEISPLDNLSRPHKTVRRERVLQDWELQRAWEAASDLGYPDGPFLKTLILTAQRTKEVGGADWGEMDLDRRIWVIPGVRTKNGLPQLVPITSQMIELFDLYWPKQSRTGLLFTTSVGTQKQSNGHLKKRFDKAIAHRMTLAAEATDRVPREMDHFRLHDIRRSVATGLQPLGVPIEHIEALLNHVSGTHTGHTDIIRVYQLYRYEPEKRAALEKWHAHIAHLLSQPDAWPGGRVLEP